MAKESRSEQRLVATAPAGGSSRECQGRRGFILTESLPAAVNARTAALDAVVFGVDVQSGDIRGDAPSYALAAFDGESIERDVVTYRKLRRRIDSEVPAIVATDNMYELAEDKDSLVHLLGSLPDETKLVQVTGATEPEPLSRVAARHGVPYGKDPMKEAEAAARLAAANVGQEVTAFTDTTEIKVSRGRSTGGGGWSEDRYTRRIHGSVKRRTREVESTLDEAGIDYERDVTEKYGGFANAVFTVERRPSEIPVSGERAGDVRVEIERVRRDGVEFRPLAKRRDHVLVGIDPGTTTAVAVVGIDGEVLDVVSTRTADMAAVIEWIIERGRPILVAADVTPMPETVEKIRRSFDAAGWTPDRDLPVDTKKHRTREEGYDDDHQRDAMAAALAAFDDHEDQFERVARKVPPRQEVGEVLARVIADEEPVEAVLADLADDEGEDDEEENEHTERELTEEEKQIKRLKARVDRLEEHTDTLKETIEQKDEKLREYEDELSAARREERREARERREVTRLERENDRLERKVEEQGDRIEDLEGKLERLKALWKLDHSNFADVSEKKAGLVPVKVIEQFTTDAIEVAQESVGIVEDDVVLLRDASGAGHSTAQRLADIQPRLVLRNGGLSDVADRVLFERDVPVAPADLVTVQEVDELAVARESEVEDAIEDWRERARKRRRQQSAEMVDRLISEHRAGERE
jgi:predicted RNase H-like nuclease (RuvC/YqgF family)